MTTGVKKRGRGRPKEEVEDKIDLGMVSRLAEKGHTDADIAYITGIGERTLERWKKSTEYMAALKKGKDIQDNKVVQSLNKRAKGYEYEETTIEEYLVKDAKGFFIAERRHVKKVKKHVPADTAAAFIWLKNRAPRDWRDKHELVGNPDEPLIFRVVYESEPVASKE